MHKIIGSDFEIDLSMMKISVVEENSWFSDKYFSKYSFPFEFQLSDELNNKMGDLLSVESYSQKKSFEVKYQFYNRLETAILIIESIKDKTIKCSLKYGIDEIPGAEIYLSDLRLQKHTVENIYTHVRQTLSKNYPETNYNFPMIYTDKYSAEDEMFSHFHGLLNMNHPFFGVYPNYVDEDDKMINQNIIHPLVYLLYILKKGFLNSGLTITGDIVNDELLKRLLIFSPKDYFLPATHGEELFLHITSDDAEPLNPESPIFPLRDIEKEVIIPDPGKYNVIGEFKAIGDLATEAFVVIELNGIKVFEIKTSLFISVKSGSIYLDFIVPVDTPNAVLKAYVRTFVNEYETILDLEIIPIYYLDENGNKITGLVNANEVDLNRAVPNITFGNFVTNVLTQFNYSIDKIENGNIHINRVNRGMRENEVINLSQFENLEYERKPKFDIDFHFKYDAEGEIELPGVYISSNEFVETTKDFKRDVQNTIQIKPFPLQSYITSLGLLTVDGSVGSDDKMYLVLYKAVNVSVDYTVPQSPQELSMLNIYNGYHSDWISNRIQATEFSFSFTAEIESLVEFDTKKRGYMFNQTHLFKTINKTEIAPGLFEVECESENLAL